MFIFSYRLIELGAGCDEAQTDSKQTQDRHNGQRTPRMPDVLIFDPTSLYVVKNMTAKKTATEYAVFSQCSACAVAAAAAAVTDKAA